MVASRQLVSALLLLSARGLAVSVPVPYAEQLRLMAQMRDDGHRALGVVVARLRVGDQVRIRRG